MNNIIIIGAGGQSQVVLEALEYYKENNVIGYLDNDVTLKGKIISGYPVIGNISKLSELIDKKLIDSAIIAIGDSYARKKYSKLIEEKNLRVVNAIHPKSIISNRAKLGKGIFVGAGAVIGPYSEVDDYCIVNVNSVIPHYNKIESYVNIAPGVSMGGGCKIGHNSFIGIGASLKQYINIVHDCIVGAGAVVICDLKESGVYVGIPAKQKNISNKDIVYKISDI
ncbi:MAG: acetyltransferase [Clostridium sp.]|uniref:acetyltransferase n=1 Tax=Clostridium sp. DSM 8431 TaxID=1761781 RepID=UPI0008E35FA3|nr:acetyltransferase [Clostridium sp. DSM 8431]MCR4943544.1 acetyltransferase [Clostridium sp.]SFU65815.1 sugar O-acyltransferase, sialic acid O-acetyltransferase NeuD family [Clostridium sp. DSM 8431]